MSKLETSKTVTSIRKEADAGDLSSESLMTDIDDSEMSNIQKIRANLQKKALTVRQPQTTLKHHMTSKPKQKLPLLKKMTDYYDNYVKEDNLKGIVSNRNQRYIDFRSSST
jgi:hypothetical protein